MIVSQGWRIHADDLDDAKTKFPERQQSRVVTVPVTNKQNADSLNAISSIAVYRWCMLCTHE